MERIKQLIHNNKRIMHILSFVYRLIGMNYIHGKKGIRYKAKGAFAKKCRIYNYGHNNEVSFGPGGRLKQIEIRMYGNNNKVIIDEDCELTRVIIWASEGSLIHIMHNTHMTRDDDLSAIERTSLVIGPRCLFSDHVSIRTGDSHSIIDINGDRLNKSKDIMIEEHVWIGQGVTILKGVDVGADTIIGAKSLLTSKKYPPNTILAGTPAKIVRDKVNWDPNLI